MKGTEDMRRERRGPTARAGIRNAALGALALAALALTTARAEPPESALSATVTEVVDQRLKLDKGTQAGVREQQVFDIYSEAKVYSLPLSGGQALRVTHVLVGRAVVVKADTTFAYARAYESFADKGKIAVNGVAVLNAAVQPPALKPTVSLKDAAPKKVPWRTVVPIKLDPHVESGRRAYYEWSTDAGSTFLRGVEVAPGVFRTSLPENEWVAPFAAKKANATVKVTDTAGEHTATTLPVESSGPGDQRPSSFHSKRAFSSRPLFAAVRDVAFDPRNRMFVIDGKSGVFSDSWVRGLDDKGQDLGSAKIENHNFSALAVTDEAFYFLDLKDNTVQRYAANVELSKVFAQQPVILGEKGDGNGRFKEPADLAVAPDGAVLVLDAGQRCVQRFDRDGKFAYSFGVPGDGDHQLQKPVALSVGLDGTVYVLDDGRKRVVAFREGRAVGADIEAGVPGEELRGLASDPFDGSVHVLEARQGQLKHFSASGAVLGKLQAANPDDPSSLVKPVRVRIDATRIVHVVDREGGSLVRCDSESGAFVSRSGGVEMSKKIRIAASAEGDVAALDRDGRFVVRFDTHGWMTARFGGEGDGPGQLRTPEGIAVDAAGQIYVIDAKKVELLKYMASGVHLKSTSGGSPTFEELRDLQITSRREALTVVQQRDEKPLWIFQTDMSGWYMQLPRGSGFFKNIRRGTTVGRLTPAEGDKSQAVLWVVDDKGERVSHFAWGSSDPIPVDHPFDDVTGITASCADVVFICDNGKKTIAVYSGSDGRFMTELKDDDGCKKPLDVASDDLGRLFVYDEDKRQIVEMGE